MFFFYFTSHNNDLFRPNSLSKPNTFTSQSNHLCRPKPRNKPDTFLSHKNDLFPPKGKNTHTAACDLICGNKSTALFPRIKSQAAGRPAVCVFTLTHCTNRTLLYHTAILLIGGRPPDKIRQRLSYLAPTYAVGSLLFKSLITVQESECSCVI